MEGLLKRQNQLYIWISFVLVTSSNAKVSSSKCQEDNGLKYLWGDAMTDSSDCIGPNNMPYPRAAISRIFRSSEIWMGSSRMGRSKQIVDPLITRKALLMAHQRNLDIDTPTISRRSGRAGTTSANVPSCASPSRLCKTRYNTTAPMYGVSLTSGQPVTIVQKFPDLLQQVVFEVCESNECDVVRGECTQTYVPYLFLVIPLGPVTLTGQDYVLVESGCVCKPKFSTQNSYGSYSNSEASSTVPQV